MDKHRCLLDSEGTGIEDGRAHGRAPSNKRRLLIAGLVAAVTGIALWGLHMCGSSVGPAWLSPANRTDTAAALSKSDKVQVELFVMSQCPDAVKVEGVFGNVVREVYSIMDVQLNFIGRPNPNATYGVDCKHGDSECRGNIDELCALAHGGGDLPAFWRFLSCLNARFRDIGRDSDLSLKCASSAGLDTSAFFNCATTLEGRQLLKQSAENAQFAAVNTSATVFIDGQSRCVEDAGWRDCPGGHAATDFIRDICAAYKGPRPRPSICAEFPSL
ncbi:hypothetical protein LPJ70_001349 [Coemansia sp. RSA 2708]|nr:hypothetical protein LPJ70_001349 [Coemansia sp. RSA 2708]